MTSNVTKIRKKIDEKSKTNQNRLISKPLQLQILKLQDNRIMHTDYEAGFIVIIFSQKITKIDFIRKYLLRLISL